jgi:hypothetical protein
MMDTMTTKLAILPMMNTSRSAPCQDAAQKEFTQLATKQKERKRLHFTDVARVNANQVTSIMRKRVPSIKVWFGIG